MKFDVSRDFLDGLMVTHPQSGEQRGEMQIGGGLHFLPSSPDGKLHTVIAHFSLSLQGSEQPFARGGWRFLYTTDEKFEPQQDPNNQFLKNLLVLGTSKVLTAINSLFLHAGLPIVPVDPNRLARAAQPVQGPAMEGGSNGAGAGAGGDADAGN